MTYCTIQAPYPEAPEGFKCLTIALDPVDGGEEEALNFRLQLIPGRFMELTKEEAANIRGFAGEISEHTVDGWGYDYFHVQMGTEAVSTMMTVEGSNDNERTCTFVPITSPRLVSYNSTAPLVVYIPEGADLHYSVWTAGEEISAGTE